MLSFNVESIQDTLTRLLTMGGRMDGKIHHSVYGKVMHAFCVAALCMNIDAILA